jgi:hypothetical protein
MTEQNNQQQTPKEHPEIAEHEWIDNCFRVYETQYGLWHSAMKDGRELITALTKDVCIQMTRFYLKGEQEGWSSDTSRVVNDGVVGGKL